MVFPITFHYIYNIILFFFFLTDQDKQNFWNMLKKDVGKHFRDKHQLYMSVF